MKTIVDESIFGRVISPGMTLSRYNKAVQNISTL